jgi:hypothetical protein
VRVWVDHASCVPLRMQFFAIGGTLAKELRADPASLAQHGPVWIATGFQLKDLHEQTDTTLQVGDVEIDVDLPDRLFSERLLAQGN